MNSSSVNVRFFDQLTPDAAYVLGFLAAGSVKTQHRKVLRISVNQRRSERLASVLSLLQSQHQVQEHGGRLVVEVGNSYLVSRLLANFNWPPRRGVPDPPLPAITDDLLPHFARGHLDRTGLQNAVGLRWTGAPQHTEQLASRIRQATGVGRPVQIQCRAKLNVFWTADNDVAILHDWLTASRHSTV